MAHLKYVSHTPTLAQQGDTTPIETIILTLLSVFFIEWDNYNVVIQNLQKFYSKTP